MIYPPACLFLFLPSANAILGVLYVEHHQDDQAIAEEERAVALDPNNASMYIGQADVFNLAGKPEEALRALAHVMQLSPRHPPPNYTYELAWAYRATGRYAEAISALQEFLNRKPDSLAANTHLALNYLLQRVSQQSPDDQTLEQALTAIHRALALNDAHH